ncbi:MAG: hypothetical protein KDK51_05010, partial [Deltaproteobacteria bacterium]|nr:hypothetical protein [Deltaproteobacteria bacterium]
MKKTSLFTLLVLALPLLVQAQPVEEEITDDAPTYEIEVIESPEQIEEAQNIEPVVPLGSETENKQVNMEPIGEVVTPEKIAETAAPEEKAQSGDIWNFSAGIGLKPLFIVAPKGKPVASYAEVTPNISLSSSFYTGTGRKFDFSLDYGFLWDEYYDKADGTLRGFEHDTTLGLGMDITDKFATKLTLHANYNFGVSQNETSLPTWLSFSSLNFTHKTTEELSLNFGYGADYSNNPRGAIYSSSLGIPNDLDDIRAGNFGFSPDGQAGVDDIVLAPNTFFINNKARIGGSYAIPKGPKVGLNYDYVFSTITNDAQTDWKGHYVTLSFSQKAWEGGSISLSNQLRLQNFQTATVASNAL